MEVGKVSSSSSSSRNRGRLHEEFTSLSPPWSLGVFVLHSSIDKVCRYLKSLPSHIAEIEMYPSLEIRYLHSYNKW